MPKKKTHEEFVEEMKVKNPNIEILGRYINSTTKIGSYNNRFTFGSVNRRAKPS